MADHARASLSTGSTGRALRFGWEVTTAHLGTFAALILISVLLQLLDRALSETPRWGIRLVGELLIQLARFSLAMMWIRIALQLHDHPQVRDGDRFPTVGDYASFVVTTLCYGMLVGAGLCLFVVPGLYWAVRYAPALWVVVDERRAPIAAFRRAGVLTRGVGWDLFGFGLVLLSINLLGALALGIGLFFTLPTTIMAATYVYHDLKRDRPAAT